jgi:hypothetical protein
MNFTPRHSKPFFMFQKFSSALSYVIGASLLLWSISAFAQATSNHGHKFEQITDLLPDPNNYRNIDGAPGPQYWQQRCDYDIECTLDVQNLRLNGSENISYYNQSPQTLRYLWLQLDENQHAVGTDNQVFDPTSINSTMSEGQMLGLNPAQGKDKFGCKIQEVVDANGKALKYTINQTMMRIELPEALKPDGTFSFRIKWHYYLVDRIALEEIASASATNLARGGYEYFPDDDNYIFTITQWYPRLCAYSDFAGWQNKQFTGRGEFALTFGNFVVKMSLPSDYVVAATGECLNYATLLSPAQYSRWQQAQTAKEPIEIVTLEEAKKNEKAKRSSELKTWIYKADQVRDFAWGASRKFVWDALANTTEEGKKVMCMSYYAKEAYPIYRRYSTKAIQHTINTYSKYTIPFPYPTAISVEAANGMEYPMICFNPGRAEPDGTYAESTKIDAVSTIIHEVGHNYFPMIINSDERQWSWFDEGLNSFVQFIAEREMDNNYQPWFGPAHQIVDYMRLPKDQLEPIMTNSDNIVDFFANAYRKPATALNVLRETVMGRELFDYAFKEYCRRWAFKHPTPADFFRTMEDASGVDLDWFWRGWFYTVDAVDISLDSIKYYRVDLENDPIKKQLSESSKIEKPFDDINKLHNKQAGKIPLIERDTSLKDFYTTYRPWQTKDSIQETMVYLYDQTYSKEEKLKRFGDKHYYELQFSNKGGLVMPIILEWTFVDGSTQIERIPAEIWRKDENQFRKVFVKDKMVKAVRLDPFRETADIDESNNNWPVKQVPTRFQVFKAHREEAGLNPMQKAKDKKIKP